MAGEEDKVEIKVTSEGTQQVAKDFDQMAGAMEKTVRTQKMLNDTGADIQRRNRIEDVKREARELNNVSHSFRNVAQNVVPANDALQKATFQFGQFRAASAASAALLGNLGRSFTQIVPAAGGFQSVLQSGGMAMSQFLGILGGGPGILLGGAVAALGMLATAMANSKKEAEELAAETKRNNEELQEYLKTIGELRSKASERIGASKQAREYEDKFRSGSLSSDEYAAERAGSKDLRGQLGDITRRKNAAYAAGNQGDNVRTLAALETQAMNAPIRGEQARVFEQKAREREAAAAQNAEDLRMARHAEEVARADQEARAKGGGKAERTGFGFQAPEETQRQLQALSDLSVKMATDTQVAEYAVWKTGHDEKYAALQTELDERIRVENEVIAVQKEKEGERRALEAEADAKMRERNQLFTSMVMQNSQMVASTLIKAYTDMAKGHKVQLGTILEGVGDQMVAQGTFYIFDGIARLISLNPGGAALVGVGTAMVAAGTGLGAAGANSAGGSNADARTATKDRTNYADPYGDTQAGRTNGGGNAGGPTVVNVYMPSVLTPTAEDGLRVQEALRKSRGVYGEAA